jgi:SsrA-binding protein
MAKPKLADKKSLALNRKAHYDYHILETIEAGIALTGSEIKSMRGGRASIAEAYVRPLAGELWLLGAHIAQYQPAGQLNHDPKRDRKLLVHRKQLRELARAVEVEGMAIVPLRLYLKRGMVKLEIALAKGKKRYDKRATIAKRDAERQMQRALRRRE